jgi:hypothetical protein
MERNSAQAGMRSERPQAALTPRPVRLLLVGTVHPGRERAVREAQARFPVDAAAESGIEAVEAFIGSGYYTLLFESSSNDMQQTLTSCLNDERVKAFFATLEPDVVGMPGPEWHLAPEDQFHTQGLAGDGSDRVDPAFGTASLPLAANMYRWRVGQQPEVGEEPHRFGN